MHKHHAMHIMKTGVIYSRANLFHLRGLCVILSDLVDKEKEIIPTGVMIKKIEKHKYE